jgi:hypothetical protein
MAINSGRLIARDFVAATGETLLPAQFKLDEPPSNLSTIELKLIYQQYKTPTAFETDFQRMITNVKALNQPGSLKYEDAEQMGKALNQYMRMHKQGLNKGAGPASSPTPRLTEGGRASSEPETEVDHQALKRRSGRFSKGVSEDKITPKAGAHLTPTGYFGLSFQQAQEKLMEDIINHQEDPELAFIPFITAIIY